MDFDPKMMIRYQFEQSFLPQLLFSDKSREVIVAILHKQGGFFADCLNMIAGEENLGDVYAAEDFTVRPVPFYDDDKKLQFAIIAVDMPEAGGITLCSRLFISHDGEFANVGYYMAEKSFGMSMLCGRDADENHLNYGPSPDGLIAQLKRIEEFCRDRYCAG